MRNRLHSALILLLILVLPMQAQAALGMPRYEPIPVAHAECSMRMEHGQMAAHAPGSGHPYFKLSFCSLCAFCVSAVALAQPFISQRDGASQVLALMASPRLPEVILDTPERPPRHLSF
ncbi:conserved exported hypothetical protein [Pseudomonas sp. 8Z]|uniref:hypothetical protein n=1 Tax=Pseudomonas sp. 8Z TaxID=2653166 RepID=UPI0012F31402|nr:hypothetical protein [Pseudomonas sp. 8Z]VXC35932.1 conserved exported hypothetical protein [Pseudomonas sp. 8Z]